MVETLQKIGMIYAHLVPRGIVDMPQLFRRGMSNGCWDYCVGELESLKESLPPELQADYKEKVLSRKRGGAIYSTGQSSRKSVITIGFNPPYGEAIIHGSILTIPCYNFFLAWQDQEPDKDHVKSVLESIVERFFLRETLDHEISRQCIAIHKREAVGKDSTTLSRGLDLLREYFNPGKQIKVFPDGSNGYVKKIVL